MQTYISLLRGINVSGQKLIKMDALKSMYEELGLLNVRTYIQSGNILFASTNQSTSSLAEEISAGIKKHFSFDVPVLVKNSADWIGYIRRNPFPDKDISKICLTFLHAKVQNPDSVAFNKVKHSNEQFEIIDNTVYLYLPNGFGRTKLSNNYIEKQLSVTATTRNWKTVLKLQDMTKE